MAKKILILLAVLALLSSSVYADSKAVSLRATGYDWLGYSAEDKRAFAGLLYIALDAKKDKYKAEDVIKKLDNFYYTAMEKAKADPINVDEDKLLKIPCVRVVTET